MALKKCEDCGKKYSDRAEACPHCACPNDDLKVVPTEIAPIKPKKKKGIIMLIIILLLAIVSGFFSFIVIGFSTSDYYFYNTNPYGYKDLLLQGIIMVGSNIILLITFIVILVRLFIKKDSIFKKLIVIVALLGIIISTSLYVPKLIQAKSLNHDASVKHLIDAGYKKEDAKRLKEEIFDKLFGNLSGVYYENFIQYATIDYIDEKTNMFTFSDYYNGFAAYVIINNNELVDIYWKFTDDIYLYYVKNGERTALCDYYMKINLTEYTETAIYEFKMNVEWDIKNLLKSPSTAEFNYRLYYDRATSLLYYKVTVDSQNSFGAMVRTDFRVDLKNTPSEELEYSLSVMNS